MYIYIYTFTYIYIYFFGNLINSRMVNLMGTTRAFTYGNNTDRYIHIILGHYFTSELYTSFYISRLRQHRK